MKIKWYGHAAFRLTTADGTGIIIDPYESGGFGGAIAYGPITDRASIVLVTHSHADHNYTSSIPGPYSEVREEGAYDLHGVKIRAVATFHDESKGKERGNNLILVIEADGLSCVHLGDLGHALSDDLVKRIGKTDVLMLPVGGYFTIDAEVATKVMNALRPAITIPMHYKTEKVDFPITGVEGFVQGKERVKRINGSEIEVTRETLPKEPEIVLLRHAK